MAGYISSSYTQLRSLVESTGNDALPSASALETAKNSIPKSLPPTGLGSPDTIFHLLNQLVPAFNGQKTSSNYYGFVTGGVLPIAEIADNIVTAYDQNVFIHLPDQTISTTVEDRALSMLVELLGLGEGWEGKTFTTGATGANVLGLACGREAVISSRLGDSEGVGELGILAACMKAGVKEIQILTSMGHSSLFKAASIVGIGRASVKDIGVSKKEPWILDVSILEQELKRQKEGIMSIVVLSAGEVNTGRFATAGVGEIQKIRNLCDEYGAWLHVDGAFGLFARCLPPVPEFKTIIQSASGLELADSICGDGHKMLNVPYDCGFFLTRSSTILSTIFQNPNAAYLSADVSNIPSPGNTGLENSRRFRALPVYAVLLAYGLSGMQDMFARQVRLARGIAAFLDKHESFELLAQEKERDGFEAIHIVVLFRAKDDELNAQLVKKINATRKMYVSGTKWEGKPAVRIAVSTWKVEVERDLRVVSEVLGGVLGPV